MQRIPVESSVILSIGYHEPAHLLEIEFHSGDVYQYENISPQLFADFLAAGSKGRFFNQFLKDYPTKKVSSE